MPFFIGGPKDGAPVPVPLWALSVIEMEQKLYNGATIVYYYELDESNHDWFYKGQEGA